MGYGTLDEKKKPFLDFYGNLGFEEKSLRSVVKTFFFGLQSKFWEKFYQIGVRTFIFLVFSRFVIGTENYIAAEGATGVESL